MGDFFEELFDEAEDFFEDFFEHLLERRPKEPSKKKTLVVNGVAVAVRPAYVFAERVDNALKGIFGVSIFISAVTASFLGFSSLSELLDALIFSFWGRAVMLIIGLSYLLIAVWKFMHLGKNL